jgi:hydroxymethylpyrimidine pyrophosphatase-like HAD family hydrolase
MIFVRHFLKSIGFDCIVSENGVLLYYPDTREERSLDDHPPDAFIEALREKQVQLLFKIQPPWTERRCHMQNYAEGELGADKWFYFWRPQQKLKLKAQNLITFTELAEKVDDET